MTTLILSIHIISCILLILIVLLQTGKGADMGASFGSASGQSLFGGGGPATALSKITTVVAIIFMLTSLSMAYISGHKSSQTIMPDITSSAESSVSTAASSKEEIPVESDSTKAASTKEDPAKSK
ncbi:MAG: preprotein translocase subunit SecG [Desulfamplus sp.]|nr:preprotein translocase subunit SecG [Desulfamplus sp.]